MLSERWQRARQRRQVGDVCAAHAQSPCALPGVELGAARVDKELLRALLRVAAIEGCAPGAGDEVAAAGYSESPTLKPTQSSHLSLRRVTHSTKTGDVVAQTISIRSS